MSTLTNSQTTLLQTLEIDSNSADLQKQIQAKIQALQAQKKPTETRIVMKFPFNLAPVKIAILPLMKKDGLKEIAEEIHKNLRKTGISADYDESGSVGKRYRRQDEIGTPWCLVVDYETKEDNTVTLRHRDTMEQTRVQISDVQNWLNEAQF